MAEFRMPALGADMTEGTLLEWLVHPGDEVHRGDVIAVVDTDKAAIDVEVFDDGVIDRLLVEPGVKVPVGTALADIRSAAAAAAPPAAAAAAPPVAATPPSTEPQHAEPQHAEPRVESPIVRHLAHTAGVDLSSVPGSGPGGVITRHDVESVAVPPAAATAPPAGDTEWVRASPLARRAAREAGIALTDLVGTGPDGAIVAADVGHPQPIQPTPATPRAAEPVAEPVAEPAADRSTTRRLATAALMARSKREIPHYYLTATVDVGAVMAWLAEHNAGRPVGERVVPAALLLKAAALAARQVPALNGFWLDGDFRPSDSVHLGVAVSLRGGGLVAPAILDADRLDVDSLMTALRELVARARSGRLRQREMNSATLTVSNLGDNGVEAVYGVIYPPQVALLGLGRVVDRPWARDGMLGVRPTVTTTLSADHRASDGHVGSRYLTALDELLQNPEEL